MNRKQRLPQSDVCESIAGEEDPGAALDVVRNIVEAASGGDDALARPTIYLECRAGADHIGVDVGWQPCGSGSTATLLGLVVAHHGEIADAAWSTFSRTGARSIGLEIDESADGKIHVSRKDS